MAAQDQIVSELRRFNRFYTKRIGLLEKTLTESPFTLAEARVLFEIGHSDSERTGGFSASDIIAELSLDPAYLTRILKRLSAANLVRTERDAGDGRRRVLSLTKSGRAALQRLQDAADTHLQDVVGGMGECERRELGGALQATQRLLGSRTGAAKIVLRPHAIGDVGWVIERQSRMYAEEYGWNGEYEALVCEIGGKFLREFKPGREACWIAERDGVRLGAVFLAERTPDVGQLRMLHVERSARGQGIGKLLVAACVEGARQAGYRQLMLWTNDILAEARGIYERVGFRLTEQENHRSFGHDLVGQNWELELAGN